MPIAATIPEPTPIPEQGRSASTLIPAEARTDASTVRIKVLNYIRSCGNEGATCEQIELTLKMSHQTVSARCRELRIHPQHGNQIKVLVVDGKPVKRPTISGRSAQVYVAC
jgi:hypothetical protein